jgi:hypothetical protein
MQKLLTYENAKTIKSAKFGYYTGILYLAPADMSGLINLCPKASVGCKAACLNSAGRGRFDAVQSARLKKTAWFVNDRDGFLNQLRRDIQTGKKKAASLGLKFAVRLNGTSDRPDIPRKLAPEFPDVLFYDYTALPRPYQRELSNYRIVFSRKEDNDNAVMDALKNNVSVAAVFDVKKGKPLPASYKGFPVVDGDEHDAIFLQPRGVWIGLRAKGKAKQDSSGFVIKL